MREYIISDNEAGQRFDKYLAKLFKDASQFNKRVRQLAARNTELTDEEMEHIDTVFEKVSIMSI